MLLLFGTWGLHVEGGKELQPAGRAGQCGVGTHGAAASESALSEAGGAYGLKEGYHLESRVVDYAVKKQKPVLPDSFEEMLSWVSASCTEAQGIGHAAARIQAVVRAWQATRPPGDIV